jgi:hypothetical protein
LFTCPLSHWDRCIIYKFNLFIAVDTTCWPIDWTADVYTIQPVFRLYSVYSYFQPIEQLVGQHAVSCTQTCNLLAKRLDKPAVSCIQTSNRLANRWHRVNRALIMWCSPEMRYIQAASSGSLHVKPVTQFHKALAAWREHRAYRLPVLCGVSGKRLQGRS